MSGNYFRSIIPSLYLIAKNNKLIGYFAKAEKHSAGYLLQKIKTKILPKDTCKNLEHFIKDKKQNIFSCQFKF